MATGILEKYQGKIVEVENTDIDEPKDLEEMEVLKVVEYGADMSALDVTNALAPTKKEEKVPEVLTEDKEEVKQASPKRLSASQMLLKSVQPDMVPQLNKTSVPVRFSGKFGALTVRYKNVYIDDIYVVLVSDLNDETQYQPPTSEEPFVVQYEEEFYKVLSPGIAFELEHEGLNITVLLIEGGK